MSEKAYTFDDYLNCTLLDVHRWSEYPEVLAVRKHMLEELGYTGTRKEINHVTVVLLNLYYAFCLDPEMWVMFHRGSDYFQQGKRYNRLFIKQDILIATVDKLYELGYIEHALGFKDRRPGGKAFSSKMKATPKLIELIEKQHGVTFNMIGKYAPDELIVLRNAEGEDIDYADDNDNVKVMLPVLVAYNKLLGETYIDIHFDVPDIQPLIDKRRKQKNKETGEPKDYRLVINLTNKRVRRIFNKSNFSNGGRFYGGWWQNMPSTLRQHIIIDKDYTIETDFSALHIYLLYALKGINFSDLEKEAYIYPKDKDPKELRPILKVLLLAAVNSKTPEECIRAVQYEINMNRAEFPDEIPNLKEAYQMFTEYHSDIADLFCSKKGLKLQRWDSAIAETVVNIMTARGIPVLVVHDSFVCSKKEETFLIDIMSKAFLMHATGYGICDELKQEFSSNPIGMKTKDITLKKSEALRDDDILVDYLGWLDEPQGRRFTNYLLDGNPTTNVVMKVFNERITERGYDIREPVFIDEPMFFDEEHEV